MPADFESGAMRRDEPENGGWRAIGAAWALTVAMTLALAGFSTIACHAGALRQPPAVVTHIVIPQHDPGCAGTDVGGPHPAACSDAPLVAPIGGGL